MHTFGTFKKMSMRLSNGDDVLLMTNQNVLGYLKSILGGLQHIMSTIMPTRDDLEPHLKNLQDRGNRALIVNET